MEDTIPIHVRTVNQVAAKTISSWRDTIRPIVSAAETVEGWVTACLSHVGEHVSVVFGEKLAYEGHSLCLSSYADVTIVRQHVRVPLFSVTKPVQADGVCYFVWDSAYGNAKPASTTERPRDEKIKDGIVARLAPYIEPFLDKAWSAGFACVLRKLAAGHRVVAVLDEPLTFLRYRSGTWIIQSASPVESDALWCILDDCVREPIIRKSPA